MYDRRVVRGNTFAALVIPVSKYITLPSNHPLQSHIDMQPDPAAVQKQQAVARAKKNRLHQLKVNYHWAARCYPSCCNAWILYSNKECSKSKWCSSRWMATKWWMVVILTMQALKVNRWVTTSRCHLHRWCHLVTGMSWMTDTTWSMRIWLSQTTTLIDL